MPAAHHDVVHLISLVEAAKAQAAKLGADAGTTGALLEQALLAARELEARGGRADEGLRPEELNTANDE